ncbi:hypothetical protein FJZ36_02425 [Candidatus Poribacteria bacterium]|nr:hypothetical protein [Candidatus Poribacteria bacterium]
MRRIASLIALTLCGWWSLTPAAHAAVSSTGELNVLNDPSGRVPTSSKPRLILTLLVDRSQAEVGEEIKTVQVIMPAGFVATDGDLREVRIEGAPVPFVGSTAGTTLRFTLANPIDNFLSSIIEVIFDVQTPDLPQKEALFRIAIRNLSDLQIGEFIKPGEIDGNPANNNDYTLEVFPNVPPASPTGIAAVADPDGDNDVIVTWTPVDDADVTGYLIYRDGGLPADALGRDRTSFRDVNVPAGAHRYEVAAYKSRLVVSARSGAVSATVGRDTNPPKPVAVVIVEPIAQNTGVRWVPSASPDVVSYDLMFARAGEASVVLTTVPADAAAKEYEFLHRERLDVGRYRYAVVAVDEAGNRSDPTETWHVLLETPFPNPFTPLGNAPFNRVTFPTRALGDAEGDMVVTLFDLHGRKVRQLDPSPQDTQWDGRDESGELLPGGIYVYQIEIGGQVRIGTIVLVR